MYIKLLPLSLGHKFGVPLLFRNHGFSLELLRFCIAAERIWSFCFALPTMPTPDPERLNHKWGDPYRNYCDHEFDWKLRRREMQPHLLP